MRLVKVTIAAVNFEPGSSKKYKTGSWRSMKPIYNKEKCVKCHLCYIYCPDSAIRKLEDGIEIDYDYCKGCGICAYECSANKVAKMKAMREGISEERWEKALAEATDGLDAVTDDEVREFLKEFALLMVKEEK